MDITWIDRIVDGSFYVKIALNFWIAIGGLDLGRKERFCGG